MPSVRRARPSSSIMSAPMGSQGKGQGHEGNGKGACWTCGDPWHRSWNCPKGKGGGKKGCGPCIPFPGWGKGAWGGWKGDGWKGNGKGGVAQGGCKGAWGLWEDEEQVGTEQEALSLVGHEDFPAWGDVKAMPKTMKTTRSDEPLKVDLKDYLRPRAVPKGIRTHNSFDLLCLEVVENEKEGQGVTCEGLSVVEEGFPRVDKANPKRKDKVPNMYTKSKPTKCSDDVAAKGQAEETQDVEEQKDEETKTALCGLFGADLETKGMEGETVWHHLQTVMDSWRRRVCCPGLHGPEGEGGGVGAQS